MTDVAAYKIIELVVLFGAVAGFCLWQIRTVSKLQRERSEVENRQSSEREQL